MPSTEGDMKGVETSVVRLRRGLWNGIQYRGQP